MYGWLGWMRLNFLLPVLNFFTGLWRNFYDVVIYANRWKFYIDGLGNTLIMACFACAIGLLIGLVLAVFKVASANMGDKKPGTWLKRLGARTLRLGGILAEIYTTVIRGTPVVLQLLIIYYSIFSKSDMEMKIYIAGLAFGINSGAYVCEIIRAGIQSVDRGQSEAGRSLGLGEMATMRLIILPQAVKNILPTLFNEFISLLKETSVAGWIAITDVTRAGDVVRSRTWNFSPLYVSAAIYLTLVLLLAWLQKGLERRMQAGDRRS